MSSARRPQRILLIRLSHLGDVVLTMPLYHALHGAFPRAEIAWVIQPEFEDLVRGLPGLARTFVFERRGGLRAWKRLLPELRRFGADWAVDAQGNLKSAACLLGSGAERRSGPARADWREPLGALAMNDPAPELTPDRRHAVQRTLALAQHLVGEPGDQPRFDVAVSDAERARGRTMLDERLGPGSTGVLVSLSSPEDVRGWPRTRWVELLEALTASGARVLVLSGPEMAAFGRSVADASQGLGERVQHWVGQRGLRELAGLFAAAAERRLRLVSCDSGPAHLAAACGLQVVALAGPQDADRTGPWSPSEGPSHRVVRTARELDCAPCLARRCRHPEGAVCMSGIEVASVVTHCLPS